MTRLSKCKYEFESFRYNKQVILKDGTKKEPGMESLKILNFQLKLYVIEIKEKSKSSSRMKQKPKEDKSKQGTSQSSRGVSQAFPRVKTVETYTAGIRNNLEEKADSLNVTGFNKLTKLNKDIQTPPDLTQVPPKITAQNEKPQVPNPPQNPKTTSFPPKSSSQTSYPAPTPNPFSLFGSKKPFSEKPPAQNTQNAQNLRQSQMKLNGRNIRLSTTLTKKPHICSRFYKRGNKPIMWCQEEDSEVIKYHNQKR